MRHIASLVTGLCLALAGCAGVVETGGGRVADCRAVFAEIDALVDAAGVRDAEATGVRGFPYLRVNRFLASYRSEPMESAQRDAWVERMRELDRQARWVELANLPLSDRSHLRSFLADMRAMPAEPVAAVERCADVLWQHHEASGAAGALSSAARVPDNYSFGLRLVGLYPITSIGVAAGFAGWKASFLTSFDVPAADLPVLGVLDAYRPVTAEGSARPLPAAEVAAILASSRDNALAIPEPKGSDLRRLIEAFAPVWQIDRLGAADLIGHPVWRLNDGQLRVDVDLDRSVAFTRLSHARFGGDILPQISYTIWFRERPKNGNFDLLGGWLDAVIWRVTIGLDGRPLVYDTIHGCGCYHLFFPVPPLERKAMPEDKDLREEALVPALGPQADVRERVTVRLSAGSHYLESVGTAAGSGLADQAKTYRLIPMGDVPELVLRSAPLPSGAGGGRRSIFGSDGLISGTERLERFLLWPMGIASAGAMRQWGTHATAFIGRRHFDDPYLIEQAFRR